FGSENIHNHILALTDILIDTLKKLDGVRLISPDNYNERGGIVTIELLKDSADDVFKKLTDENVIISLREGRLRFSPHFYNSSEEVLKAVKILTGVVS
ncbi:MAG TPA: aminotransferase class V-fold PLP-dependent enzyme, partial [Patescibacteria group bacterium]|nr:aminotransferase class V-fold PLP-dependent enzyme [Patescibacteria group bacterium]